MCDDNRYLSDYDVSDKSDVLSDDGEQFSDEGDVSDEGDSSDVENARTVLMFDTIVLPTMDQSVRNGFNIAVEMGLNRYDLMRLFLDSRLRQR